MDQPSTPEITPAVRRDGWSEPRKTRFLAHLAQYGNVRAACAAVGMSHEAAYQLRRRDSLFARVAGGCRSGDGCRRPRRYDSRLLLAHMARLDATAESAGVREDAERFDELLALVGGAGPSDNLVCDDDGVPLSREASIALAEEAAEAFAREEAGEDPGDGDVLSPGERYVVGVEAAAQWDAWRDEAHATVDRLLAQPLCGTTTAVPAWTLSGASTSALAQAIVGGHPAAA